ncbi:MAG: aldehyde dehydrogenase family protein [Pseudomonadota bacterium]
MNSSLFPIDSSVSFISVNNPFDGVEVGTVANIPPEDAQMIIQAAKEGARVCRSLPRYERARVLETCASLVERDKDTFTDLIVAEAGKTVKQAKKEVLRCVNTLKLSADEARRNGGEVIPFDAYAGSENRQGWFTREPLGIIVAITPYNDPLNLVAHKLGPAIAGGNAVILKPSDLTPLSAIKLVDYLMAAGMPSNVVSVATGGAALGEALVSSRDVRMISFTGGFATGEKIAKGAGLKKLAMDLGGNAPVIVLGDCDIEDAVESCLSGAFWAAGQNCIGTQRILIQSSVYEEFKKRFVAGAKALKVGNPKALTSYEAVAATSDARLGIIPGQIQFDSAKSAGVSDSQIIMFKHQPDAVAALLAGKIDAFAATAVGNRVIASENKELEAIAHEIGKDEKAPVGAFSFSKSNQSLLHAVNEQLRGYLGSADHRTRMAKYGLTQTEIDGITESKK